MNSFSGPEDSAKVPTVANSVFGIRLKKRNLGFDGIFVVDRSFNEGVEVVVSVEGYDPR